MLRGIARRPFSNTCCRKYWKPTFNTYSNQEEKKKVWLQAKNEAGRNDCTFLRDSIQCKLHLDYHLEVVRWDQLMILAFTYALKMQQTRTSPQLHSLRTSHRRNNLSSKGKQLAYQMIADLPQCFTFYITSSDFWFPIF